MCLGNLRGIREKPADLRPIPTYLFAGVAVVMIVIGIVRETTGDLPHVAPGPDGRYRITLPADRVRRRLHHGASLRQRRLVADRHRGRVQRGQRAARAEGRNARQILAAQGTIVAFLIAGISWLAHLTHAMPYTAGFPTILAQEAAVVFGPTPAGHAMFLVLQAATAAILFTGGNTSFTGFPFLASFVAEDSFLPRWLTRRGHRLVFSNGIMLLTALALALMLVAGATVDALIAFYAIGVFTGFAMAGFGMARYHRRTREAGGVAD